MASNLAQRGDHRPVAGLSEDELAAIERECLGGARLPAAYRHFMKAMGRCAGPLLRGTDVFYPEVAERYQERWEWIREDSGGTLPPAGAFIFASHQGYQYYWMPVDADGNPPVYEYEEADGVVREWDSFTDFIAYEFSRIRV